MDFEVLVKMAFIFSFACSLMNECSFVQACSNEDIREFEASIDERPPSDGELEVYDKMRDICSENEACRRVFSIAIYCDASSYDCSL